jgi:hypothetical protein
MQSYENTNDTLHRTRKIFLKLIWNYEKPEKPKAPLTKRTKQESRYYLTSKHINRITLIKVA